ncbi:MAG: dimethylmenaquinone methyltransferase [Bryobacterales bacterium]|nr:dimethylmenaquinone methyltransferase [Bryobacterales bacterium]
MIKYTAQNPFDRFPDGRPKVPDALLAAFQEMSSEEVMGAGRAGGGFGAPPAAAAPGRGTAGARGAGAPGGAGAQAGRGAAPGGAAAQSAITYTDGWQVLNPGKKLIGRAFTLQLMPWRGDIASVDQAEWKQKGNELTLNHQSALDMLQPGDVFVVDAGGNLDAGGIIGDNLAYYIWKKTGTGFVIDGAIRDLEGIATFGMAGYYRGAVPPAITGVMVTGINVPVRIGKATVMPGDLVFGDREGVNFIPPQAVQRFVENAKTTHIHDEWTRKKFDENKYKSSDIYGSPRDPALRQEYQEYLKQQLERQKK